MDKRLMASLDKIRISPVSTTVPPPTFIPQPPPPHGARDANEESEGCYTKSSFSHLISIASLMLFGLMTDPLTYSSVLSVLEVLSTIWEREETKSWPQVSKIVSLTLSNTPSSLDLRKYNFGFCVVVWTYYCISNCSRFWYSLIPSSLFYASFPVHGKTHKSSKIENWNPQSLDCWSQSEQTDGHGKLREWERKFLIRLAALSVVFVWKWGLLVSGE